MWKPVLGAALLALGVITAPTAAGDPPCLFPGDWDCSPAPRVWPGQLQPTWDVPPYGGSDYGVMCDPSTLNCERFVDPGYGPGY